ncbi:hypothetical protein CPB85DRAFT_1427649 [Mucidula mucida]|nr:hypothetical protein CPB85DRAFT_1427649 [Mucidula mucida]
MKLKLGLKQTPKPQEVLVPSCSYIPPLTLPAYIRKKNSRARKPIKRAVIVRRQYTDATAQRKAIPFITPDHIVSTYHTNIQTIYYRSNEAPLYQESLDMLREVQDAKQELFSLTVLPKSPSEREEFSARRYRLSRIIIDYKAMLSCLRGFPTELLLILFKFLSGDGHVNLFARKCDLTRVARVCRRWRSIIASSTFLYGVLNVDVNRIHSEPLVTLAPSLLEDWLKWSGSRPLAISLTCSEKANTDVGAVILHSILGRSHLWKYLRIAVPNKLFPAIYGVKNRVPLLQRLVVVIPRDHKAHFDVFLNAPRLNNVVIEGCFDATVSDMVGLPWSQLTRYKFRGNEGFGAHPRPKNFINQASSILTLMKCKNVEECSFNVRFPFRDRRILSSSDWHSLPRVKKLCLRDGMGDGAMLNVLALPALEELILARGAGLRAQLNLEQFLSRNACPLKSLVIGGDLANITILARLLPLIPNLTHLDIRVTTRIGFPLFELLNPQYCLGDCLAPKLEELSWDFARDESGAVSEAFSQMLQARCQDNEINGVTRLRRLNLRILRRGDPLVKKVFMWREVFDLNVELRYRWKVQRLAKPAEPPFTAEGFNPWA